MDQFIATETLIIELLLIVSVVALVVRRLRIPYTVALVIVGLLLTFQQPVTIDLTPELILALFVPPLVFEAAFHLDYRRLRDNLLPILTLAVPGVLLTTLIVGTVVRMGGGITLTTGLVFGALISATDPVAVVALFRALGAPRRLVILVEGESLFNDGTAIVVFNLVLAAALTAAPDPTLGLGLLNGVVEFVRVSVGGVAIGVGLGWMAAWVIGRVDDYLIEITVTTVLAFGAYLLAERVHVSGVLAVVGAGIVCGTLGPRGMSPTTQIVLVNFWEYLAFVANSLVFLLIGLDVNIPQLLAQSGPIGLAVGAVLLSRALVVYGLSGLLNLRRPRLSWPYQHVLFWGGLRGAIGLALVLSLPASFADRELLRVMTYGVVLFTLLIQGVTMNPLLRRLGLIEREAGQLEYERRHAQLMTALAARQRIEELHRTGMVSSATWEQLAPSLEAAIATSRVAQQVLLAEQPSLRDAELEATRREGLRAQRATLTALLSDGAISEPVYEELVAQVDAALTGDNGGEPEAPPAALGS
ncbi:MAG: Na+/H+ antiporter [Chloroflexales bacterium]|nr:Na+/H+ antiporter [Chloroflexales bacterium]